MLPVVRYLVPHAIADISVQQVVADVGLRAFHPFYADRPLVYVKIVGVEVVHVKWHLPVKLGSDVSPELGRVFDRSLVQLSILLQTLNIGSFDQARVRRVN